MKKIKVGLALGSGAARGMAHIGVLEVLQKEGISVDMIAGTSAGAAAGAIYARWQNAGLIRGLVLGMGWKKMTSWMDFVPRKSGFIDGSRIMDILKTVISADTEFKDLEIPFACVATDIDTGEEVVIREGSVLKAIRASISIPGIFTVVSRQGRYLVDGGLVNPVPISILREMGADFIIAVNVIPSVSRRIPPVGEGKAAKPSPPNLFNVLVQSLYTSIYSLAKSCAEVADIVIEPRVGHIGPVDFSRAQECIEQGEMAAREAIPEIKRRLKQ
ncbi:patatin-like phospholipase family protein [Chloroflexota bacterium]